MPMFDPDTGKVTDPDALRSIQWSGKAGTRPTEIVDRQADTKTVQTFREDDGTPNGWDTFHGSGRVDTTVTVPTVSRSGAVRNLGG